ncbi:hypothetical protein BSU04_37445 [Caballeronia sordidicola]|uniref:Uncharacterized protein n=1 Tax=Caballeronia sordidicola TaxID=196367 RepID=A0A226WQI1_CABSO|nr:hypothetical protein BSU04_37445 [Caballeronia sordidicola]
MVLPTSGERVGWTGSNGVTGGLKITGLLGGFGWLLIWSESK